jgi:hypothetical protein
MRLKSEGIERKGKTLVGRCKSCPNSYFAFYREYTGRIHEYPSTEEKAGCTKEYFPTHVMKA